jgi:hypothetical protein
MMAIPRSSHPSGAALARTGRFCFYKNFLIASQVV